LGLEVTLLEVRSLELDAAVLILVLDDETHERPLRCCVEDFLFLPKTSIDVSDLLLQALKRSFDILDALL